MNNNPVQSFRESERSVADVDSPSQRGIDIGNRELFHYLMHVEDYPGAISGARMKIEKLLLRLSESKGNASVDIDGQNIDRFFNQLERCLRSGIDTGSSSLCFPSWEGYIQHEHSGKIDGLQESGMEQAAVALRLLAPCLLLQPCWLQSAGQANIAHTPASVFLFRIYAASVGHESRAGLNRNRIYLTLQKYGLSMPKMESLASVIQSGIPDWAFRPPVVYLCLCQNIRNLFPEVLGFTLAHIFTPLPTLYPLPFRTIDTSRTSLLADNQESSAENKNNVIKAVENYLSDQSGTTAWKQMQFGFKLYLKLHSELAANIDKHLARHQTREHRVINIFRRKAAYAAGHHRDLKLGNRSLDEWFLAAEFDGDAFLKELFKAGYFDRESPRDSLFLKQLIAFDGPMFGVFTQQEVNTIIDWLENLHVNQSSVSSDFFEDTPSFQREQRVVPSVMQHYSRRDLFYSLLNIDHCPEILPVAKKRVKHALAGASRSISRNNTDDLGLTRYSHQAFEKRIQTLYQKEIKKYRQFEAPPKIGKKVYEWGILQFAPTILVDGCWLQSIARVDCWDSRLHSKLFQILADELGGGIPEQNHPNVYRKLLKSLNISLPSVDTQAFAHHPNFLDTAFDIPNYLLAISHFPKTFLPEIIGLNLAIELGGLGAVYQRLVDELEFWKIDAQIIRLHISIDNLSSGHSAIATEVVMLYLDGILNRHGDEAMQDHWKRIRIGYNALGFVTRRFKLAILWQYSTRMLVPEITRLSRSYLNLNP